MTTVNIEPLKLAKYLQVAASQRKRSLVQFTADFGQDSQVVAEVNAEYQEITAAIATLVKDAAKAPLRK